MKLKQVSTNNKSIIMKYSRVTRVNVNSHAVGLSRTSAVTNGSYFVAGDSLFSNDLIDLAQ